MKKVYISPDKKIIIYNYGINTINGKSWQELADKSANQIQQSEITDINMALDTVEKEISADVLAELSNNQIDNLCAFVVILKTKGNKWSAGEITWERGQNIKKTPLGRFIWSGSGKRYLHINDKQREDSYWASRRVKEAQAQIDKLYNVAIENQNRDHGLEFSPTSDDWIIH